MTKGLHPRALTLRIWASKIERNLLDAQEAQNIAEVLRRVANGETLDQVLGIKRAANRPRTERTKYYVEQVHELMQPVFSPKDQRLLPGRAVTEAIDEVAKVCHVSTSTVKAAYYSPEGVRYLDELNARLVDPPT